MRKHLIDKLLARAEVDQKVFLLIGDLGYSVVEKFRDKFPERFLNLGVSEQAGIGIAAGLAATHLPVYYSIGNFPSFRCLEQIRNDVAHEQNPVMIVSLGAGFSYGTAGYSHHAIEDAGAVASIFGMRVATPSCIHELDQILEGHWQTPAPVYLRLGSAETCDSCLTQVPASLGHQARGAKSKSDTLSDKLLLVTHGEIGKEARVAISDSGANVTHVSLSEFNSFDTPTLNFISSHQRVITVEEHAAEFGFGARIRSRLANVNFESFEIIGVPMLDFHIGGRREFHLERSELDRVSLSDRLRQANARPLK